ncbi:hypothetical protein SAMN04487866_11532 [Thermoactinomyces sp. DSM 45891]|uniref:hypothetical protein n=1 Tax=unclassified Thermoactinomyces TaxID=2634588 RepID=UPI0008992D6C|nr:MULTISPECIES: hypothetical protein [unclassified Thermoactinomyces]SDZ16176.1 hypothetical protein SAMN05444416_1154 [Thermoactinomyces sp. DSM 45892]SFX64813.1 hypothetical protein SAMN04487866_11532 [Thermoactinomyces sp. DSM 45891]
MSRQDAKKTIQMYDPAGQKNVEISRVELERVSGGNGANEEITTLITTMVCKAIEVTVNDGCGMKSSLATPCKRC